MLERQLCTEICMSRDDAQLARYQAAFARDWTALWRRVFRCHRHHRPGTRRDRRPDGAAARGIVGHPAEMLKALPGYGPDIAQRRVKARQIMETLGYGSDKRLAVTIAARNVPPWRDPTLILIDQLKEIYIDGELEPVDTTQWYPRLMRKDYKVVLNVTESEVDDPDAQFYENYKCGASRNYSGYCNASVDELIDRQSQEMNADKRRQLVRQIERKLIEEDARPDILYVRGITCRRPYVKDLISMVNSIYNGSRFEDVWLDN